MAREGSLGGRVPGTWRGLIKLEMACRGNAIGSLPGQPSSVWENPDPGEAFELRGFFRDALEFPPKVEACCDSSSNEAAVEPMAPRSPSHESNSPSAGLLDPQGLGGW